MLKDSINAMKVSNNGHRNEKISYGERSSGIRKRLNKETKFSKTFH